MRGFFGSTAALLGVLGLSSTAWAQQQDGPDYGPHMWGGGGWMIFGPLMMIVFIVAIVVVVRWLGGSGHGGAPYRPPGKTPSISSRSPSRTARSTRTNLRSVGALSANKQHLAEENPS